MQPSPGLRANWALAYALWISAVALLSQGNLERSQPLFEEGLALCKETKNKRGVAYALCMLGITALSQRAYTIADLLRQHQPARHRARQASHVSPSLPIPFCHPGFPALELHSPHRLVRSHRPGLARKILQAALHRRPRCSIHQSRHPREMKEIDIKQTKDIP